MSKKKSLKQKPPLEADEDRMREAEAAGKAAGFQTDGNHGVTLLLDTCRSLRAEIESINTTGERWLHAWPVGFGFYWYWLIRPESPPIRDLHADTLMEVMIYWLPIAVTFFLARQAWLDIKHIHSIAAHLRLVEKALGIPEILGWESKCHGKRIGRNDYELLYHEGGRMKSWTLALVVSVLVSAVVWAKSEREFRNEQGLMAGKGQTAASTSGGGPLKLQQRADETVVHKQEPIASGPAKTSDTAKE